MKNTLAYGSCIFYLVLHGRLWLTAMRYLDGRRVDLRALANTEELSHVDIFFS